MNSKKNLIWVLVNCNTIKEAQTIGKAVLNKRLASCFDIFRREQATYFWPPKSGKTESAKGALLVLETFQEKYDQASKLVKSLHSDKLPFVGYIPIQGVGDSYLKWIKREIK